MIYLFTGNDSENKRKAYEKFVASLPKNSDVINISRNGFDPMQIESLHSSASLFSVKSTVMFFGILEYQENRDFILEKLSLIAQSDNDFIFLEGKLLKPVLDTFVKAKADIKNFELPKAKLERFDNFLIANAFAAHDKLNLWIYFRQAVDLGVVMEELSGVLFWKLKDMLLKRNYGKFTESQLKNYVAKLSYLLPEARASGLDAEAAFEQFLLEAF